MKRTRTRILSLLMALAMCLSLLPATAMAIVGTESYTVTFDAAGGTFPDGSGTQSIPTGSAGFIAYYPDEPTREGYTFVNWGGMDADELKYHVFTSNETVRAVWESNPGDVSYTVTFDANGGKFPDGTATMAVKTKWMGAGNNITTTPPDPTREGYDFLGWEIDAVGNYDFTSDTTVKAKWLELAVTFDPNGGTCDVKSLPLVNWTLEGPLPVPTRSGYTFEGWYRWYKSPSDPGRKIEAGETFTAPETVIALWSKPGAEKVGFHEVWFHLNGGKVVSVAGHKPDASGDIILDDGQWFYTERPDDGDEILGEMMTDEYGQLPALPVIEREGYTFDGWYTAETGGDKVSEQTVFTGAGQWGRDYLWAHWTKSDGAFTVTFDLNGASGKAPDPQKVEAGKTVKLPNAYANGFRLMGWGYREEGATTLKPWKTADPVNGNLTLYAIWEYDRFSFNNNTPDFFTSGSGTYAIDGKYYDALTSGLSTEAEALVLAFMESSWGGSCFGMSALYCLRCAGRIDPGAFQTGAEVLFDLAAPKNSTTVFNLVNYYFLQQYRPECIDAIRSDPTTAANVCSGKYAKDLVAAFNSTDLPIEIGFFYGGTGSSYSTAFTLLEALGKGQIDGHSVVGLSCSPSASGDGYDVLVWDPNTEEVNTMAISADGKTVTFRSAYGAKYYKNAHIRSHLPTSQSQRTFDHLNIQSYLKGGMGTTNTVSYQGAPVITSLTDFVITAANGSYAEVRNGIKSAGNLEISYIMPMGGAGTAGKSQYFFPDADSYTITTSADTSGTISILLGGCCTTLTSSGVKELKVTGSGQISVSSDKAAKQTISVSSDQLGSTWNNVTVSGSDTNLTLEVGKGTVKVSSQNNVPVSVTGGKVGSEAKSPVQNITANGTSVAMESLGSGTQQPSRPAGANPFTDVAAGTYYYDAVLWAVANNITGGTSATTFSPSNPCTRAQIVTFLWRAAGSPKPTTTANPFTDVKSDAYYYDAVLWAAEKGITGGTSATTFSPNSSCTRGQTVTFLWRYAGEPKAAAGTNPFRDVDAGAYYYNAVLWAAEKGITGGTSATTFSPADTVTRAQTVTFLYRSQG